MAISQNITISQIAEKAGVSIATVSNVLHGKVTVNSEIVARVHRIIDEPLKKKPGTGYCLQ